MLKFLILFVITVSAIAEPLRKNIHLKNNLRIIGGQNASIEFFPYQVSLHTNGQFFCGGAIISKKWVLTSATCQVTSGNQIRAGSTFSNTGGSFHTVVKTIPHKDFTYDETGSPVNDIALVEVLEPFEFDRTRQPVPLLNAGEQVEPGSAGLVAGWGITEYGYPSNNLLSVSVLTYSKDQCDDSYQSFGGVPQGQICAGQPDGGKDACAGDGGSPLVVNDRAVGIVSWGLGCGLPSFPGVYTDISAYRSWVDENIKANL